MSTCAAGEPQDADLSGSSVAVSDLARLADLIADLDDPDVMDRAWR